MRDQADCDRSKDDSLALALHRQAALRRAEASGLKRDYSRVVLAYAERYGILGIVKIAPTPP